MAQNPTQIERKSRKKDSHSSSKASKSRSTTKKSLTPHPATDIYIQDYAPPVAAVSAQYLHPHQPFPQNTTGPPSQAPTCSTGPPQHPVYGQTPRNPPLCGQSYGSFPPQTLQPHTSRSTMRLASPSPSRSRDEGLFSGQWNKLDRLAAKSYADLRNGACKGATKITANYIERPTNTVTMKSMQALCQGAALCDIISSKFDAVITSIDGDRFSGEEQDLMIYSDQQKPSLSSSPPLVESRGQPPNPAYPMLGGDKGSNHFSKVWLYSNSRLPPHLLPFKVYTPTYPLLCLAATYSERVYTPPGSKSREMETHIPANWRSGTKAMVLKSVPIDDMNTVVFAVRGSQTFMDWAVNYNSAPTSPGGFLEDETNLCHAGFLYVAKKMIKPVADRLRVLLQENPARSNCSLLITGHSAGGAVAALLYAHMLSSHTESELNYLTGFFKRVHCVTFGAPPISLRPLQKPTDKRHRKSLFYAFINEGDPVPRADKTFVKSLLKLYASPAPSLTTVGSTTTSMSKLNLNLTPSQSLTSEPPKSKVKSGLVPRLTRPSKTSLKTITSNVSGTSSSAPAWPIPPCTLSPAGRLIVLREKVGVVRGRNGEQIVEAVTVDDETLRKVMYGDPLKHQMRVYRKRIEEIATRAVIGGGY